MRYCIKGTLGGSTVAGTFEYMSPEHFAGKASPGTDLGPSASSGWSG